MNHAGRQTPFETTLVCNQSSFEGALNRSFFLQTLKKATLGRPSLGRSRRRQEPRCCQQGGHRLKGHDLSEGLRAAVLQPIRILRPKLRGIKRPSTYIYIYISLDISICIYIYMCIGIYTRIHNDIHIHIHIHIYIYIYMYIHIHTSAYFLSAYLSIYLSIYPSINYLSACLSIHLTT